MRPANLRHVLRLAALQAIAVPATAGVVLAACGGSVESTLFAGGDGSTPGEDSGSPSDSASPDGFVADGSVPNPDGAWIPDGTFDAREPDGACGVPGPIPTCGSVVVSCIPTGLVLGQNSTCSFCSAGGPGGFGVGCFVIAQASGDYSIACQCAVGRFPAGLSLIESPANGVEDPVGVFLARGAALEASAVRAFEQLAREVAAHGAPPALVRRLRRAARQEIRHARLLGAAAKARGAKIPRVRARRAPVYARSLFALALENAVEGCGREAIGGALLHVQAMRAEDARLRAVLAELADDECAHAELSADLAAWIASRLDAAELARLDDARRAFFEACAATPPSGDPVVARVLGLPSPVAWRRLVGAVEEGMRAAA